jgi:hypothetical protein
MAETHVTIVGIAVTPNTEDPDVGGFFASFVDGWGRGHGFTELEAVFNLVLLKGEQEEESWPSQAGDVVVCGTIPNVAIEKALERRYGGRIEYNGQIPALGI